uniref:Uncharacterized protein n=1 Tax=Pristionchus pacificus TaxID=54126 RepID=A0A2A6CU54_PRIPA|eukprot:PDM81648.1 hypothetical protein PRIPAC_30629 [Pristionchus pacificus]
MGSEEEIEEREEGEGLDIGLDERVMKESKTGSVVQTEIGEKGRRREVRKVEWKGGVSFPEKEKRRGRREEEEKKMETLHLLEKEQ